MNETAEVFTNIPALIVLSVWWAFLSTVEFLSRAKHPDETAETPTCPAETGSRSQNDPNLLELISRDPHFSADTFLEGAKRAYEAVLSAYGRGDRDVLRSLLSPDVMRAFEADMLERDEKGITLQLLFVGFENVEITAMDAGPKVEVSVLFRSLIVRSERAANGDVVSGDPAAVVLTSDLWTFSRKHPAESGQWHVVATQEA